MSDKNFPDVIHEIHAKDDRFGKGAYYFIREALDHTLKSMEKNRGKNKGHVSGGELLEGIKDYALERFGPMTLTLMDHWNVKNAGTSETLSSTLWIMESLEEPRTILWPTSKVDTISKRPSKAPFAKFVRRTHRRFGGTQLARIISLRKDSKGGKPMRSTQGPDRDS